MRIISLIFCFAIVGCSSPSVENPYRKAGRFQGGINVPVALIVGEWAGVPKFMGSGWIMEGSTDLLLSAKHVTDGFMGEIVELGASECKAFINNRAYTCLVVQVPALRDAVVLKLQGPSSSNDLPVPYKISTEKVKVGDRLFIQGFHPHPFSIMQSNEVEGFKDFSIPILRDFYELRIADPLMRQEIVFDSLGSTVVSVDERIKVEKQEQEPLGNLKFMVNDYIKVTMDRNHKFSFGGLSGGVALRINSKGEHEAVGIITAEKPVRFEYDKRASLTIKNRPKQLPIH